jgi:hypothetical protein
MCNRKLRDSWEIWCSKEASESKKKKKKQILEGTLSLKNAFLFDWYSD